MNHNSNKVLHDTITINTDKYLENINSLLLPNNFRVNVYPNNVISANRKKEKEKLNILYDKLKLATTQFENIEKENQQLVNENKILKLNLEILMDRYGLTYKTV
jgi:flagellar basal body rod protein FlgF